MSSQAYRFLLYTWLKRVDVERLAEYLSSSFSVVPLHRPEHGPLEIAGPNIQEKFLVKADTLQAYLSPTRAMIFQKERAPFTERDLKLRERIFIHYPRKSSTPFPWNLLQEPPFEVEQKTPQR